MQPSTAGKRRYRGFRATGAMMKTLSQVDPSLGGAVLVTSEGPL